MMLLTLLTCDRVAQRHEVQPAAAAPSAGGGAELATHRDQVLADLVVELGRQWPGADARRIRLEHADDRVDLERPHARRRCIAPPAIGLLLVTYG